MFFLIMKGFDFFGPEHRVQNVNMVQNSRKIRPKWSVSYK